jgi:hypothetical protein
MLDDLLERRREAILEGWRSRIFDTYPADTARFMKSAADRFANPVGHVLSSGIKELYAELLAGCDSERFFSILDGILRIRSVQDFTPREAVGFVFLLKDVVRETLANEIRDGSLHGELRSFEDRVDRLALMAFETYTCCREDLYNIRIRSIQSGPFQPHRRRGRKNGETKDIDLNSNESKE